jgi:hypothetical protein
MQPFKKYILHQLAFKPSYLLWTSLAFLGLNLFWLAAQEWIFVSRPYINYDYTIALWLTPFSMVAAWVVLLFVYLQEIFISNAMIFNFGSFGKFLQAGVFANELQLFDMIQASDIVMFGCFMGVAWVSFRILNKRTNALSILIVLALSFLGDQLNGSSYLIKSDSQVLPGNVAGSSTLKIVKSVLESQKDPGLAIRLSPHEAILSPDQIISWAQQNPQRSVLFIIVESYGQNKNDDLNNWIQNQILKPDVLQHYRAETGLSLFSGSTTSAELRHLCGLGGNYASIMDSVDMEQCLPNRFRQEGYKTTGVHGFSKFMFRRQDWWPTLGLDRMLFVNEFMEMDAPFCGSGLYGICDEFVIEYLGQEIKKQRGFYYHLTLNTHFPVVRWPLDPELAHICDQPDISSQVCFLSKRVGVYFDRLAQVLLSLPEKPLVVMVGDHAPPFSETSSRTYLGDKTPYIILYPKS